MLMQTSVNSDWLTQLIQTGYIVPLGIVSLGILIGIVGTIAGVWQKVRHAEMEASLKHKMLDQGMSADDIQKVLDAGGRASSRGCCDSSRKNARDSRG
jgi:hypothetical protein